MPKHSSDLQKQRAAEVHTTHGLYGIKEYRAWISMKRRCYNKNSLDYKNYGGRGIQVCEEWINDFMAFYSHVGDAPTPEHTLDRIENDDDYRPGNVRWATRTQQNRNTRRSKKK